MHVLIRNKFYRRGSSRMSHWEASLPTAASGFPHRGQRERALLRPQTVTRAARSPVPDLSGPRGTKRQLSAPALRRAAVCQPSPGSSVFLSGSAGWARDSPFEVTKPHFLPRQWKRPGTRRPLFTSRPLRPVGVGVITSCGMRVWPPSGPQRVGV